MTYESYAEYHTKLIKLIDKMNMEELKILLEKAKEIKGENKNAHNY